MERSPILLCWQNYHCENDHSTKATCRFDMIPIKILTAFVIETEQEEQGWRDYHSKSQPWGFTSLWS